MKTKKDWIFIRPVYPFIVVEASNAKPEYYYNISKREAETRYRAKYCLLGVRLHRVKDYTEFIELI